MTGLFAVAGLTRHANALSLTQLQTASLGVGGSVLLASQVEFWVGQAIVAEAGAADLVGELGGDVALYWVARRVKSAEVWTVDPFVPEKVTIP